MKTYVANELNQYTAIDNPDAVGLRGDATNNAMVTLNGEAAIRDNVASDVQPWHYALPADNANGADYTFASIVGVVNPAGTNTMDSVDSATGFIYAPPRNETPTYDDDGNLLSDGHWHYTWNGENRLVCAEERVCPTNRTLRKVEYAYDHQGRMVWKEIKHRDAEAQSWEEEKATSYLWDDFNIIAEITVSDSATNTTYNVWGLDLDGTLQGVGGVGGLLTVVKDGDAYHPAFDANGNIMEYVSIDGSIVAHREYDPFGGTVVAMGEANAFAHWFSTKPWCSITGLSEYQFRKYSPVKGRWLSRDPHANEEAFGLYSFVKNTTIQRIDDLGAKSIGASEFVSSQLFYQTYVDEIFSGWDNETCICKYYKKFSLWEITETWTTIVTWADDSYWGFGTDKLATGIPIIGFAVSVYNHFRPNVFTKMPNDAQVISEVTTLTSTTKVQVENSLINDINANPLTFEEPSKNEEECKKGLKTMIPVGGRKPLTVEGYE